VIEVETQKSDEVKLHGNTVRVNTGNTEAVSEITFANDADPSDTPESKGADGLSEGEELAEEDTQDNR
jgi:hypothetical protein